MNGITAASRRSAGAIAQALGQVAPAIEPSSQNVTSRSGRPSSSKLRCASQRVRPTTASGATTGPTGDGAVLLMSETLDRVTDQIR